MVVLCKRVYKMLIEVCCCMENINCIFCMFLLQIDNYAALFF